MEERDVDAAVLNARRTTAIASGRVRGVSRAYARARIAITY
jgi:hypothetical protein